MADMGLSEFCQSAASVDFDRLIDQFTALERRASELRGILEQRNSEKARDLDDQFALLSSVLFAPVGAPAHASAAS